MNKLICTGLACPQPVLITRKYLEENPAAGSVTVVVDNRAAAENIVRFLENSGFTAGITTIENGFEIEGSRIKGDEVQCSRFDPSESKKTLIMITNDVIGNGDRELGEKLMQNFLKTLPEMGDSLWRLVFLNEGVKLSVKDSPALPALTQLETMGVSILVCGTCLDYYSLLDKKGIGIITNMLDIVTSLQAADKIINI
ncbi:MAG: sulfurtransferase-like selenium metabolism protein YedF [Desulfobacterales bacterium]|nr:sulfurtransferase-like selenium metabolism protein YedF [Desulfobacterales bacterium]